MKRRSDKLFPKRLSFGSENPNKKVLIRSPLDAHAEHRYGAWRHSTNTDHVLPVMNPIIKFLLPVVSLLITATGWAASIQIASLPFQVTAPGTYQLTPLAVSSWASANYPTLPVYFFGARAAIYINGVDNVTIDLNNQTLDPGAPNNLNGSYAVFAQDSSNVKVANGTTGVRLLGNQ